MTPSCKCVTSCLLARIAYHSLWSVKVSCRWYEQSLLFKYQELTDCQYLLQFAVPFYMLIQLWEYLCQKVCAWYLSLSNGMSPLVCIKLIIWKNKTTKTVKEEIYSICTFWFPVISFQGQIREKKKVMNNESTAVFSSWFIEKNYTRKIIIFLLMSGSCFRWKLSFPSQSQWALPWWPKFPLWGKE